jgi:probable phosphoglycerate mutase
MQGHLDSFLTDIGKRQAEAAGNYLKKDRFNAIYSSDLGRAHETAKIIDRYLNIGIKTDERLRERKLGIFQELTIPEIKKKYPEEYARFRGGSIDYVVPEGESIRQRYERAISCIQDLADSHKDQPLLVITHGGILDSLFRKACAMALNTPRTFSLFNCSINVFSITGDGWILEAWGGIGHLQALDTLDDY